MMMPPRGDRIYEVRIESRSAKYACTSQVTGYQAWQQELNNCFGLFWLSFLLALKFLVCSVTAKEARHARLWTLRLPWNPPPAVVNTFCSLCHLTRFPLSLPAHPAPPRKREKNWKPTRSPAGFPAIEYTSFCQKCSPNKMQTVVSL